MAWSCHFLGKWRFEFSEGNAGKRPAIVSHETIEQESISFERAGFDNGVILNVVGN